jgi:hypothetical protein
VKNQIYLALIVICVSRLKSASFSSDSGFSRRGAAETWKQGRTKGTFGPTCTLNILGDRTNYKAKDIIEKITNLFCIYEKFTICNTYSYLHNLWWQNYYCGYHVRCPAAYSTLSLLHYTFLHHAIAIDYMNVHFPIMHQISN